MGDPVIAVGLATVPARRKVVHRVIDSILGQTAAPAVVYVAFNGHSAVPHPDPRVVMREAGTKNCGDLEKFFPLEEASGCSADYVATIDDDILYPPDYLECLYRWSRYYGDACAVGVHGRRMRLPCKEFYRGKLYHCCAGLDGPEPVILLGTGTMFVRRSMLLLNRPWEAAFVNRGDILAATELARQGVERVAIPRKAGWLRELPGFRRSATYTASQRQKYLEGSKRLVNRFSSVLHG